MKTNILKFTVILLILAGSFSSCKEENDEPAEISFAEEYSLDGTSCRWANLNYDANDGAGTVIRINSNKELRNYIKCENADYPEIDFSKYTLLLVSGIVYMEIGGVSKKISISSSNNCVIEIEIIPSLAQVVGVRSIWHAAFITSKLNKGNNIELSVTIIPI